MRFTIVMASRLVDYPSSSKNKEEKILRAIESVIRQTFQDWELIIISDGCKKTIEIVTKFIEDERIILFEVQHTKLWSGYPRNAGIENASGEWITYLDIDDVFGENHLQIIANHLVTYDWVWYNDIRFNPKRNFWYENQCNIHQIGKHGTSNITHKKSLPVRWPVNGKYAHDYLFVKGLLEFKNHTKIETPEYIVCHIPGIAHSGGYDL